MATHPVTMILPIPKERRPWRKPIPSNFRRIPVNPLHPGAFAEWKEYKPFYNRHIIDYGGGNKRYHYDLGNPKYPGVKPKLAYLAEEGTRWGTGAAIGVGGILGARYAVKKLSKQPGMLRKFLKVLSR